MKIVKNDLFDYENRYIFQYDKGFKFSLDSILLAEYIKLPKKGVLLDMCTGNAPIPLIVSTKYDNQIYAFEIQKEIAELAQKSVELNCLGEQIHIINDDVNNISNYFNSELFDVISCNPPYFKNNIVNYNKNDILSIARHEITINLEQIFLIASKYLKPKGNLYLVQRSERLDDIIYYARINNIPVKEIQFISTKKGGNPIIVLVRCSKNGKHGIKVKRVLDVSNSCTYKNLFG